MASTGHVVIQSPQEMHSLSPAMRTSDLQTAAHLPQLTQRLLSTAIPSKEYLLKKPYSAPKGQIKRQNGRKMTILTITRTAAKKPFHAVSIPAALRRPSLAIKSGTAPSIVPAGQIYLQNNGSPSPIITYAAGGPTQTSAKNTYLPYVNFLVKADLPTFRTGSL